MVRRNGSTREDIIRCADATRTIRVAVLKNVEGKLNANQRMIVALTAQKENCSRSLRSSPCLAQRWQTLVKRGLVELLEQPADFTISQTNPSFQIRFQFNARKKRR